MTDRVTISPEGGVNTSKEGPAETVTLAGDQMDHKVHDDNQQEKVSAEEAQEIARKAEEDKEKSKEDGEAGKDKKAEDDADKSKDKDKKADDEGEKKVDEAEFNKRLEAYTEEFTKNGKLSDDSIAKAAKEFNVSEEMVRTYVKGLGNNVQVQAQPFFDKFGGSENYGKFVNWAANNLDASEIELYDTLVNSNEPAKALTYLDTLKAKYEAAGNTSPRNLLKEGGQGRESGSEAAGFASTEEMVKAMSDPRYNTDVAYTKQVNIKVGAMGRK